MNKSLQSILMFTCLMYLTTISWFSFGCALFLAILITVLETKAQEMEMKKMKKHLDELKEIFDEMECECDECQKNNDETN